MYTLKADQEKDLKAWLDKLPTSLIKSQITNLFNEIYPTKRITAEQLEKFVATGTHLPKEFQVYPQTFANWVRNEPNTTKREEAESTPAESKADLASVASDTHADIKAKKVKGDEGKQAQEILHTLGETDPKKAGTKAIPKLASDEPTYEEELQDEAAKSAKTSGGKPEAQKKEEESIIARNKEAGAQPKEKVVKETVIIKEKDKKHK